jgi:transcriptional regulator with XRE-family HTH domain
MSQAEFARAAGWSPSTISSWERGRAKPSRLAFKTILAFAEERGVRYRPRPSTTLALAAPQAAASTEPGPAAFRAYVPPPDRAHDGPRPELRPLLYSNHTGALAPPSVSTPPRWSAEASFRLTLGARHPAPRTHLPRGVAEVAIAAAAFCLAFGLRQPLHRWLRPPPSTAVTTAVHAPVVPAGVQLSAVSAAAAPAPALVPADAPGDSPPEPALVPPVTARLESVIAIGGAARATFRTANDAVTVTGGEWLGSRQIADIESDGVTLVDRAGVRHRVHIGQRITLE